MLPETTTAVGSPSSLIVPAASGMFGLLMSINPIAWNGLSLYTSVLPSAVAEIISAEDSFSIESAGRLLATGNEAIRLKNLA